MSMLSIFGECNMGVGDATSSRAHAILIQIKCESQRDILNAGCFCSVANFFFIIIELSAAWFMHAEWHVLHISVEMPTQKYVLAKC